MALNGARRAKVREALLGAFKRDQLLRLATECMDVDFVQHVTAERTYKEQVYEFVEWVDNQGQILKLIDCALREAPRNVALQELAESAASWQLEDPTPAEVCPYKGLEFYDEQDAGFFFGREALTTTLLAYLRDHRFLAVIGASGSGKSSVVRAGIVPALRTGEAIPGSRAWHILVVTPTGAPLRELANKLWLPGETESAMVDFKQAMLASADALSARVQRWLDINGRPHLVLVVDQFEELFTLRKSDNDEERQRIRAESAAYIDNLLAAAAPGAPFTLILTLRADFYDRCADFPNLAAAVSDEQFYIVAMTRAELYSAIVQPAMLGGWELEDGLPEVMLDEIASEPAGSLPLLSVALEETWKRRRGIMMTLGGYQEAGGVRRAIATKAEQEYDRLSEEEKAAARTIFVKLTELGEGTQDTRRRVPLPALLAVPAAERVLQRLQHKDVRLVSAEVQGEATYVDVTHEALIREWTSLRQWLDDNRDGERYLRRLEKDAEEWDTQGRHAGLLYPAYKLQLAQEWIAKQPKALDHVTRDFIDASQNHLDEENRIAEQAADDLKASWIRELRQARLARTWALSAFSTMLLVAFLVSVLAVFFYEQYQSLEGERLLQEARQRKLALDPYGAIDKFTAAVHADPSLQINLSEEISDTLRHVATTWVQEGEARLRATGEAPTLTETAQPASPLQPGLSSQPSGAQPPSPLSPTQKISGSTRIQSPVTKPEVIIEPVYLEWAITTAPTLAGWTPDLPLQRQQAITSATALYSQALALNPPSDTPVYVWIEPGSFLMGSSDADSQAIDDEKPQHTVSLAGYWMLRTEVTNRLYGRCVDADACTPPANNYWDRPSLVRRPVVSVDWDQAVAYAAWVGGRLPSEAEWEQACRGADGALYPWGNDSPTTELANFGYSFAGTTDAGDFAPGKHGLYDMAGNALEWTSSQYDDYPYKPDGGREDSYSQNWWAFRGGSWFNDAGFVRCAARDGFVPSGWNYILGFRVVSPGF